MLTYTILGLCGILTGISASLFGFGGGFIIVPLLYHLLRTENPSSMYIAVSTSACIMIINSLNTTYKQYHNKNIMWQMVLPLMLYIAIGSALGVFLTKFMNNEIIRWFFILYISYTIGDCLIRKDFINNSSEEVKYLPQYLNVILGLLIGAVSTILGVGGSVMTVPMMRKLGIKIKDAVAMANPLSLPVALVGSIGYLILAYSQNVNLGDEYIGFIYLPALIFLVIGGFIGVPIGAKLTNKIPDAIHARVYILLLFIVLFVMII